MNKLYNVVQFLVILQATFWNWFLNGNYFVSLKFVLGGTVGNKSAVMQVMAYAVQENSHYVHQFWPTWWRHQNGNIFRVTGHLCGEFTGPGEFPTQRPVTRSIDVFFDLRLNKPWGWWFETPSWSLWRQCNKMSTAMSQPPVTARYVFALTLLLINCVS